MIPFSETTAVLISKEVCYQREVLDSITRHPFKTFVICTSCPDVATQFSLSTQVRTPFVYWQDDDAICQIGPLMRLADPAKLNCAMSTHYLESYKDSKCALLGWGSVFSIELLHRVKPYVATYGTDALWHREAGRILSYLCFDVQNRIRLEHVDMPWATAPDRLSMQPDHYANKAEVEARCALLV